MKVLGNRVLINVKKKNETKKTKMGFIIENEVSNNYITGNIVALGVGVGDNTTLANSFNTNNGVMVSFISNEENYKLSENSTSELYLVPTENVFAILDKDEYFSEVLEINC